MPVLVTCKFHNIFPELKGGNSKVNIPVWPEFELISDFMPLLVNCKFNDNPIKNISQHFFPLSVYGIVFPKLNNPIKLEIKLIQDFILVLVTCKFE